MVTHYDLNGGNGLIVSPLHDLNTVDSKSGEVDAIATDRHEDVHHTENLEQDEETDSGDCMPQTYGHSLQLQVTEDDHSLPLETEDSQRSPYAMLTEADVTPIETARARLIDVLLSNFITAHVISCDESTDYSPNGREKQKKRKSQREAQFEGDPKYILPLAYVANLYETLVGEINARLATLENVHEKTMGIALEAAGGLYRRLVKIYPKSGSTYNYKRRELASATEARNKFPQLISGEEKRVRFIVVHGLEIVERPNKMPYEDAEWFKRVTGRHEAAITERDYKFFSARHKLRKACCQTPAPAVVPTYQNYTAVSPTIVTQQAMRAISQHQVQHSIECHPDHHSHTSTNVQQHQHQPPPSLAHLSHSQHTHISHVADGMHGQHPSAQQHIPRGINPPVGGRMVIMPGKYCDECGAPFLRETSKYCSECGTKRVILTAP